MRLHMRSLLQKGITSGNVVFPPSGPTPGGPRTSAAWGDAPDRDISHTCQHIIGLFEQCLSDNQRLAGELLEFYELLNTAFAAAARIGRCRNVPEALHNLAAVIAPHETRPRVIAALHMLENKRDSLPPKKHGNIPL
mgnify:CR=1 FL=1